MRSVLTCLLALGAGFGAATWHSGTTTSQVRIVAAHRGDRAPSVAAEPAPVPETAAPSAAASTSPPSATKPPAERLRETFRGRDPFESAAQSLAVIDTLTAEELRRLGDEPGRVPLPWHFDDEYKEAFADALIERWFTVDPAGALPAIRDLEKKLIISPGKLWAGSGEFIKAVARVRPEVLLDSLPPNPVWDRFDTTIPAAFTALGRRDPDAARRYLERITDSAQRSGAEIAIAEGIAGNDPVAAVQLAHSLRAPQVFHAALAVAERSGPAAMREVLAANGGKFPIGFSLPALVLRYPDEDWASLASDPPSSQLGLTTEVISAVDRLAPADLKRRLDRLDDLPPSVRDQLAGAMVSAWVREEPRDAVTWAFTRAKPDDPQAAASQQANTAFRRWLESDRTSAASWWEHLPPSPLRDRLGNSIAVNYAHNGDLAPALALFRPTAGDPESLANVVAACAKHDTSAAAAWLETLPSGIDVTKALVPLIEKWVSRDAAAAAQWVEAQPAGPRRDAALLAYSRAAADLDPTAAGEWAAAISEPAVRTRAVEFVFSQMRRSDPPGARAWLRSLDRLDERWRERLLRLAR